MHHLIGRSAVVALAVVAAPIFAADKYGVKDDAKFFSQAAVDRANQRLEELSKKYGANYKVETVVLSAERKSKLQNASSESQSKQFRDMAERRFKELGIGERGGYILVVKSPSRVQPHFGKEAIAAHFNLENGRKLASQIAKDLSAAQGKMGDPALDNMLATLSEGAAKLRPAAPTGASAPTTAGTVGSGIKEGAAKTADTVKKTSREVIDNAKTDIAKGKEAIGGMNTSTLIIIGLIVAFVVLFALKGLFGGGRPRQPGGYAPPPQGGYSAPGGGYAPPAPGGQGMNQPLGYGRPPAPPPQNYPHQGYPQGGGGYSQQPQQGGGGGFMKGMLGGVIGGAAGAYMYDKMTGGQAHGGTPVGGGAPGDATAGGGDYGASGEFSGTGATDAGGDYGATGDFADAGSGGDYGAGGDFGAESAGGDYGAGGDFGGDAGADAGGDYGAGGDFGGDAGDFGGGGDFDEA